MNVGGSFTAVIVMENDCAALVFTLGDVFDPESTALTDTVVEPLASAAGVKVNVPSAATAGCTENNAVLVAVTVNDTDCVDSLLGPAKIDVAQPLMDAAPESSFTV